MARNGTNWHPDGKTAAVGYIRVSTDEQARGGVGLDTQRQKIIAYAELHGLEPVTIHADEGRSGKSTDKRPGLAAALDQACEQQGALIVYSLSRLARSTRDAINIAERLGKAGANLVSITENIDTTTPIGRFFFTTMAALAQLERDVIGQRTADALAAKKAKGERISGIIPYGYDLAPDGKRLIENAAEQANIATIVELRSEGLSARAIIAELEKRELKPPRGAKWHVSTVMSICRRSHLNELGDRARAESDVLAVHGAIASDYRLDRVVTVSRVATAPTGAISLSRCGERFLAGSVGCGHRFCCAGAGSG